MDPLCTNILFPTEKNIISGGRVSPLKPHETSSPLLQITRYKAYKLEGINSNLTPY